MSSVSEGAGRIQLEELKEELKEDRKDQETPPPIVMEGYVYICYDIDSEYAYILPSRISFDEILNEPQFYECNEAGGVDILSVLKKHIGKRVRVEIRVLE